MLVFSIPFQNKDACEFGPVPHADAIEKSVLNIKFNLVDILQLCIVFISTLNVSTALTPNKQSRLSQKGM